MVKRGPKTRDEFRIENALVPGVRTPPPADLEPGAAAIWRAVVMRLPADFFSFEVLPLLKAYCRHAHYADLFASAIAALRAKPGSKAQLHELHKLHGAETQRASSCATKLRLTNQSRYVPDKASSKARSAAAAISAPWHSWGDDDAASKN